MAQFPTSVKTFGPRSNGQTIDASHVNDLQDEVSAIEDGYLNGTARLNASNSTLATLNVAGGSTLTTLSVSGGSTFSTVVHFTGQPRAQARRGSSFVLPDGAWTTVDLDTEDIDVGGLFSTAAGASSRIDINSTGVWLLTGALSFAASSVGFRGVRIVDRAGNPLGAHMAVQGMNLSGIGPGICTTFLMNFSSTDTVRLQGFQGSGSTLALGTTAEQRPLLMAAKLY